MMKRLLEDYTFDQTLSYREHQLHYTPEVKVTSALADFDSLDFAGFVAELKKQKITLTLVQQDEWEDYFRDYKAACNDLTAQIAATDREIDNRIYQLYGLTEEEIKIVEG